MANGNQRQRHWNTVRLTLQNSVSYTLFGSPRQWLTLIAAIFPSHNVFEMFCILRSKSVSMTVFSSGMSMINTSHLFKSQSLCLHSYSNGNMYISRKTWLQHNNTKEQYAVTSQVSDQHWLIILLGICASWIREAATRLLCWEAPSEWEDSRFVARVRWFGFFTCLRCRPSIDPSTEYCVSSLDKAVVHSRQH